MFTVFHLLACVWCWRTPLNVDACRGSNHSFVALGSVSGRGVLDVRDVLLLRRGLRAVALVFPPAILYLV